VKSKILLFIIIGIFMFGCKKKEVYTQDQQPTKIDATGQVESLVPSNTILHYRMPPNVADLYVTCIEGVKLIITDRGGITQIPQVNGTTLCK
jgi:hypothetical protein